MKKKTIIIVAVCIVLSIVLVVGNLILVGSILVNNNEKIRLRNGNYLYSPPKEKLTYEKKENILYYKNSLSIYLTEEIDKNEENRLAKICDGKVVGRVKGAANILQIKIKDSNLKYINRLCKKLEKEKTVGIASYDFPITVGSDADENPWPYNDKNEKNKNNSKPDGNDWWAETIGAYKAWDNADKIKEYQPVGIIEVNGYDNNHEDMLDDEGRSRITFMYPESNTIDDHGTHVAGIIGASNNKIGIRGICDKSVLVCDTLRGGNKTVLTPNCIAAMEEMLIKGVKVINNSWGNRLLSKEAFNTVKNSEKQASDFKGEAATLFDEIKNDFPSYDSYLNYKKIVSKRKSLICMFNITQFIKSGYDFLIVQSSGNRFKDEEDYNTGKGFDCKELGGDFISINKQLYDEYKHCLGGYSYNDIKNHVMIVGATTKESWGTYKLTDFSNYGDTVDIVAPGKDILSTVTTADDKPNSDDKNNGKLYGQMSGTSMSAPMVTGSAAFIWSLNPKLKAADVKNILLNTAGKAYGVNGEDKNREYKMLNLGAAVDNTIQNKNDDLEDKNDKALKNKITELINKYGVASNKKLIQPINDLNSDSSWANRKGLISAKIIDLDCDGTNELITARLIGGDFNKKSKNLIIEVFYYESGHVKSAGVQRFLTGDDLTEKQIDSFVYKIKNKRYVFLEADYSIAMSDGTYIGYYLLEYRNKKLKKKFLLQSDSEPGEYYKWIETTWNKGTKKDRIIYESIYDETTGESTNKGKYKNSENPEVDYLSDFGFPKPSEKTSSINKNYFNIKGNEKLFKYSLTKEYNYNADSVKYVNSLKDYTGLR